MGLARAAELDTVPRTHCWRRPAVVLTVALVLLHGGLLAASLSDYRVTIDSAYHVAMGRAYGEQGLVPWDHINFGPGGRPNLQAPLLHAAIGGLGRLLGGRGDDYVRANAILAVTQWFAAVGTIAFFSSLLVGELAMLTAVALLSGAAFASMSFAVGLPSGWLFVLTPWAAWLFLRNRIVMASLATSAAIYSHLGGYLTAPLGIAIAAMLTRRWRALTLCGLLTTLLTLPHTIHVLRYAGWLSGIKSHSALLFDPLLDALAAAGTIRLLRNPREHPFMTAWLIAPVPWLFQDMGRFLLQWPLGGSVAAGLLIADRLNRIGDVRQRALYAGGFAVVATLLPFGLPSLASEIAWDVGNHYPRMVDWNSARLLAGQIARVSRRPELISDYNPALCPALAVYAPVTCEKGHWIEVQPRADPADNLPAEDKVYVVPLNPSDWMLAAMKSRSWIDVSGGDDEHAIVRLAQRPSIDVASAAASEIISREAAWLGNNAINNALSVADLPRLMSAVAMAEFREELAIQREHQGRLELAAVIYAWALEPDDPEQAFAMRRVALRLGVIASYLGDDSALDFVSGGNFADLREHFLELSMHSTRLALDPSPSVELMASFDSLLRTVLGNNGNLFPGRQPGDWLPWLAAVRPY
jgi:hypothetical protein